MPEVPCLVDDPELWFGQLPEQVEQAKSLCARCPGREACLEGALSRREPWGVWGGQLLVDGIIVARKRRPGRPPKASVAAPTARQSAVTTGAAPRRPRSRVS